VKTTVERTPQLTGDISEHKGISNRLLRKLGWIKVIRGNRDTPRNSEVSLQDREQLLRYRRELMSLRHDAVGFIGLVLRSHDRIWVERCESIIVER
jgi:hypothetical protein